MDCIGLLVISAEKAALTAVEDEYGYGREPWEDRLRAGLSRRFGPALPPSVAQVGDIALIRWGNAEPSHTGIFAAHPDGGLSLIHAHTLHGVIEQAVRGPVLSALVEVYRPTWVSHVN